LAPLQIPDVRPDASTDAQGRSVGLDLIRHDSEGYAPRLSAVTKIASCQAVFRA